MQKQYLLHLENIKIIQLLMNLRIHKIFLDVSDFLIQKITK